MQFDDCSGTQGSEQEFMPLRELYDKNMEFAIEHRKTLQDGMPHDTELYQTRLRTQHNASAAVWFHEMQKRTIPKIDAFIAALPTMLAEAQKLGYGPDEVWKMRPVWNCCCEENGTTCCGHVFHMEQYFLASSDYHQSGISSPDCPSSPVSSA